MLLQDSLRYINLTYMPVAGLLFMIRPTSALLWAPICIRDVYQHISDVICKRKELIKIRVRNNANQITGYIYLRRKIELKPLIIWILISAGVICYCIAVDSIRHRKIIFTPFNFFMVNIYNNSGVNNNSLHWYVVSGVWYLVSSFWYLVSGTVSLLGPLVIPLCMAIPVAPLKVLLPLLVNITALSVLPHKELRFLQSSLPFLFLIIANHLCWKIRASFQKAIKMIFLVVNISGALYLSLVHQRGVVDAAIYIGNSGQDLTEHGVDAQILLAMPCHSTPLYSHIHQNISVRFLECKPNLENDPTYREEDDIFYSSPDTWLENLKQLPDIIVFFDVLQSKIQRHLEDYQTCATFFHTMFPEGRIGGQVIVAARRNLATLACDNVSKLNYWWPFL